MADDFDVEAMLEEPYRQRGIESAILPVVDRDESNGDVSGQNRSSREHKDRPRGDGDHREHRDKDKDHDRRRRSKERDHKRGLDKEDHREKHAERDSRKGESDRDKGKNKDRGKDRDKERESAKKSRKDDDRDRRDDKGRDKKTDKDRDRRDDRNKDKREDKPKDRREDKEKDRKDDRKEEKKDEREDGGRREKESREDDEGKKDWGGGAFGGGRDWGQDGGGRGFGRFRDRGGFGGGRRFGRQRSVSPIRSNEPELSPEERDSRTIFCMQLAARIRPKDLEEFFSAVGTVRDVRLILDNKSHRSKGIAYIEFAEVDSVPLGIGLSGQKLLGVPIIVQPSHAERNRMASAQAAALKASQTGPMRLYVGSLHYNISEEMLRGIFEPFGKIDDLKLMKDHQTNRSAGYGFITYHSAEDAKKAMDQLNGFELAGRPMKVGNVTDRAGEEGGGMGFDVDEQDRMGFGLGATGRLALMAKLAEGTGMEVPLPMAVNPMNVPPTMLPTPLNLAAVPPIATQCFMLSNMFDPTRESGANWEDEVKDDVIDECNKHGGVLHIYVDRGSPDGNVYVKCPSIAAAVASVNSLHGRYFAGKVITAAYVPLPNYHSLFPDSARALQFVMPSSLQGQPPQYYMGQ